MAVTKYIRVNSDCCLFYKNEQFQNYGACTALRSEDFKEFVFKGECGTCKCPFYKRNENSIRVGNAEIMPEEATK